MSRLKLEDIGYDPKYYPRVCGQADWRTVLKYTNILNADPDYDMDPVVVVKAVGNKKNPWMLLDGLHRCGAYERAGRESIPATIERWPRSKWMARSIELNIRNQHRDLDSGDKAWCIKRLREEGMGEESIASLLMEPIERIEPIVADRAIPIDTSKAEAIPRGRSNREIGGEHFSFIKAAFQESPLLEEDAGAVAVAQLPACGMDALHILDSAIALLSCGVDMTNGEIAERIERLNRLVRGLAGQ